MKLIALGSNLPSAYGTPLETLRRAVQELTQHRFSILAKSNVYRTAPVPISDQPDFLNSVIRVEFDGSAEEALAICHRIETHMGRVRLQKNEARTLDLDILAWDSLVQFGPPQLPHPRMQDRGYVIGPLLDIAPDWLHPVLDKTTAELWAALPPTKIITIGETL